MRISARFAGLRFPARLTRTGLELSGRAKIQPGLKSSSCYRNLKITYIYSKSRAEIPARAENLHVIGPLLDQIDQRVAIQFNTSGYLRS